MLTTQVLIVVCALVACCSAGPKWGKFRSHHMEKYEYVCDSYPDAEMCHAAKARCQSSWKRSKHTMEKKEMKKANFDKCIQQLDIASLLQNFEAALSSGDMKIHGGPQKFYVDIDSDQELTDSSEMTDEGDDEVMIDSAEEMTESEEGVMTETEEGELTDGQQEMTENEQGLTAENGESDMTATEMSSGQRGPGMRFRHNMDRHEGHGNGHGHKHGKHGQRRGGLGKKFLDSLPQEKSQEFRCCIENLKENLEDGKLNRETTATKITEMITVDPTALKGFSSGIDTCPEPQECDMREFKGCILKSCIDEVLASLNPTN